MSVTFKNNDRWRVSEVRKYPKEAKLCDYIVVSEFDIDTGSTVRHQHPENIDGVTEDWLAENMLPEGVHNRDFDSTFIFLNRDGRRLDEDWLINPSVHAIPHDHNDLNLENLNTTVFRYGLNLVRTKHDANVRRGAIVKAMAVFSSYPIVDCLEGPLNASLEQYFKHPDREVLAHLYNSLNTCNMRNIPCPSILEKSLMHRGIPINPHGVNSANHIPSAWNYRIDLLPDNFKSSSNSDIITPSTIISVPLHRHLDCMGDINVTSLVRCFGEGTMRIYNAILTRQRVIFVGYNHAARDVCRMVLSAAALVSPVPCVLRRTYPYANLTDLSFLETVGYIAGVTNPMFLERDQWWDLACVLDLPNGTGSVYSPEERKRSEEHSKGGMTTSVSNGALAARGGIYGGLANVGGRLLPFENPETVQQHIQDAADSRYINGVISVISSRVIQSTVAEEEWVAERFFDYTTAIIEHIKDLSGPAMVGPRLKKKGDTEILTARVAALRISPEFLLIPLSPWSWISRTAFANTNNSIFSVESGTNEEAHSELNTLNLNVFSSSVSIYGTDPKSVGSSALELKLRSEVRRLLCGVPAINAHTEAPQIFSGILEALQSEDSVQALLWHLPQSLGGLDTLGMGLLHPNPSVRLSAVGIIEKVEEFPSTRIAVQLMNGALLVAFKKQLRLRDSGDLASLILKYGRNEKSELPHFYHTDAANSSSSSHPRDSSMSSSSSSIAKIQQSNATAVIVPPYLENTTKKSAVTDDELGVPSAFLSLAAAASGLFTGMISLGHEDPPDDVNDISVQLHEGGESSVQESNQGTIFPPIDLIPY